MAPAASSPAMAAGTAPVASSDDHADEHGEPARARARGHRLPADQVGESTTRTSGSSRCRSSAFQVPCSSSVSPAASVVSRALVLAPALHGEDDEIAAR